MNKQYCIILIFSLLINKGYCQNIINGDFENNSGLCLINIPNATYDLNMYNSTAFGTFESLDIVDNTCGFGTAQNGQFCIFVAVGNVDTNFQEAISFDLSAPLQTGTSYTLTFFDRIISGFFTAPIKIGVSSSNNTFGNLIGTIPASIINNTWTMRTINFISPINAGYITVTVGGGILNSGEAIDNFQLNNSSGINDNPAAEASVVLSPLPFSDQVNISLVNNEPSKVIFYDMASKKLLEQSFTNSVILKTSHLAKGIYLYEVRNKSGVIKKGKIAKE